jgi:NADH:ubiquinone oxidoreductase subunit E
MTSLYVCMGSTCHLKSAQSVVEVFRRKIQEYQLQDGVELKGSFCLGLCSEAVPVKVGETVIHGVTVENASEMFEREVLPLIGGQ